MALRVDKPKSNKPNPATALRDACRRLFQAVAGRSILASVVLATILAMFAAEALSSAAATPPRVTTLAATTPKVSPVTVTTTTGTPPTVTTPKVTTPLTTPTPTTSTTTPTFTTPTVTTPTVTTPTVTTPAATTPGVSAPSGSAVSHPTGSSATRGGSAGKDDRLTSSSPAARQRELRSLVVSLSKCLVILQPQAERVLLLRAGITTAGPDSPSAVAHISHISGAREAQVERGALAELESAARAESCPANIPVLIHVPPQNRLVSADPVLTSRPSRA